MTQAQTDKDLVEKRLWKAAANLAQQIEEESAKPEGSLTTPEHRASKLIPTVRAIVDTIHTMQMRDPLPTT